MHFYTGKREWQAMISSRVNILNSSSSLESGSMQGCILSIRQALSTEKMFNSELGFPVALDEIVGVSSL